MPADNKRIEKGDGAQFQDTNQKLFREPKSFKLKKNPDYLKYRLDVWEELHSKYRKHVEKKRSEKREIQITLPDGKQIDGT